MELRLSAEHWLRSLNPCPGHYSPRCAPELFRLAQHTDVAWVILFRRCGAIEVSSRLGPLRWDGRFRGHFVIRCRLMDPCTLSTSPARLLHPGRLCDPFVPLRSGTDSGDGSLPQP
ncbi:unnamed protein product [Lota lota]